MGERAKHVFHFEASKIARAAREEEKYHAERETYWREEFRKAVEVVKSTAKVVVREFDVTGGTRVDVGVDYGDVAAYQRMQEAQHKIESHRKARERFASDAQVYGSQGERSYQLDAEDVHHFRLSGKPREE